METLIITFNDLKQAIWHKSDHIDHEHCIDYEDASETDQVIVEEEALYIWRALKREIRSGDKKRQISLRDK
jgi:6-pyruvoyl-tetrahydropterin synthase